MEINSDYEKKKYYLHLNILILIISVSLYSLFLATLLFYVIQRSGTTKQH